MSKTGIWVGIVVISIVAIVMRVWVAPLIYEATTADVFKTDSQWSSNVSVAPGSNNYCTLKDQSGNALLWPLQSDKCMVEGRGIYIQTLQRTCETQNCIDFDGTIVPPGLHPFTGMCESAYCGITETWMTFGSGYITVDVSNPLQPVLQQGNTKGGSTFMMQRYGYDKDGNLVPQIDGVFVRFIFVVNAKGQAPQQFYLNYNNNTATTSSGGSVVYISQLQLTNFGNLIFPSQINNGVTLFLLMDLLNGALLNMPNDQTIMQPKILAFYSPNITQDSNLTTNVYQPFLLTINAKKPIDTFKALTTVGGGIINWYTADTIPGDHTLPDGYYVINSDYVNAFQQTTKAAQTLQALNQDIVELRLQQSHNGAVNIPFYSWST